MSGAGGTGEAGEATVDTGAISAEELAQRQAADKQALEDNVKNAQAKVEKLEAAVAAAKEAVATAKAELKGN